MLRVRPIVSAAVGPRSRRRVAPSPAQVRFWDRWLVPASERRDGRLGYRLRKSVVVVWRKPAAPEPTSRSGPLRFGEAGRGDRP